jgi:hypothetical protein
MNFRNLTLSLALAIMLLASGCRKSGESAATPASAPAPDLAAKVRPRRFSGDGVAPYIASISPETIVVHDGRAPMQRFSMTYEIGHAEKVTKAMLMVDVPGVGNVQSSELEVQPQAQIEFFLDASAADLGPTVRLRAHCPSLDTDWLTLGYDPPDYSERVLGRGAPTVSPLYIDAPVGQRSGGRAGWNIWSADYAAMYARSPGRRARRGPAGRDGARPARSRATPVWRIAGTTRSRTSLRRKPCGL